MLGVADVELLLSAREYGLAGALTGFCRVIACLSLRVRSCHQTPSIMASDAVPEEVTAATIPL